jgi:hypothetical protein
VFLLCFEPQWLGMDRQVDAPLIVVALDQSRSMEYTGFRPEEVFNFGQKIRHELGNDYRVEILGFGQDVQSFTGSRQQDKGGTPPFAFSGTATNPDGLRSWVDEQMGQNPVSAWVLLSDGQFNQGADPLSLLARDKAPIYTIACGKASSNQPYWSMGFPTAPVRVPAGSSFEIETPVQGFLKGYRSLRLELLALGMAIPSMETGTESTLADLTRVIPGLNPFISTTRLKASVGKPGIYAFKVMGMAEGSHAGSTAPNQIPNKTQERLVYVEAVETLRRIQILAQAPHPDLGVLHQTLEETRNYRVELSYGIQGLKQAAKDAAADLYILHQWPSANTEAASLDLLEQIRKQQKPLWYLGGSRSNWRLWPGDFQNQNPSNTPIPVTPALNKTWNAFAVSTEEEQMLQRLPPLTVWGPGPSSYPQNQTLLHQKIGQINSQRPLWCIDYRSNPAKAYLWGEGLWRWRLAFANSKELLKPGSENLPQAIHQRLILQTVSLLLSGRESDRFEARPLKAVFNETENVVFEGSSRNASGDFDNSVPLNLQISAGNKVLYEGGMTPSGMGYSLLAGRWAPGSYRYTATLIRNGIASVRNGNFAVSTYDLESASGLANQGLMSQLSSLNGGLAVHGISGISPKSSVRGQTAKDGSASSSDSRIPPNGNSLSLTLDHAVAVFAGHIRENPAIKPTSYQVTRLTEWLAWPLLWVFLWVILGTEWLVYRALGGK